MSSPRTDPPAPLARPALRWLPALALLLLLALLPVAVTGSFALRVGVLLLLAVVQGSAWNLVGGLAGQCSVGHAAFFGVGAYAAALLLARSPLAPGWSLPVAALAAAGAGLVVGVLTSRLRGAGFVVATLAVAELLRLSAIHLPSLTHGAEGLALGEAPALHVAGGPLRLAGERPAYYLALGLAVVAIAVSHAVRRSRLGLRLLAVRSDPDAAASLGVRLAVTRTAALALSAALTGAAGAAFVTFTRAVDPGAAFGLEVSLQMILVCLLGGIGTVEGPVIGAVLLVPLDQLLRDPGGLVRAGLLPAGAPVVDLLRQHAPHAHLLVQGLLLVLLALFLPDGVGGLARRLASRRPSPAPAQAAPAP